MPIIENCLFVLIPRVEKSIPELEKYADSLTQFAKQRLLLYNRVGTGSVKISVDNLGRIGRIKERVHNSYMRIGGEVLEIEYRIDYGLKKLARAHQSLVSAETEELRRVQRYARHIPANLIAEKEQQLERLRVAETEDPNLKRGLELLESEREAKMPHVSSYRSMFL